MKNKYYSILAWISRNPKWVDVISAGVTFGLLIGYLIK